MANRVFPYIKTAAPTVNDDTGDGYKVGDMWLDTTNDITYQAIDVTLGAAVWIKYLGRMATSRLIGRTTASTGNWEEITVGSGLSLSAGSLTATGGSGGSAFKNRLINGDFQIAQRGASFTSATTFPNNDDAYTLDRWYVLSDGNDIVDVTQETTTVPTNQLYAIALDVETVNNKFGIAQIIEQKNCVDLIGGDVTLSFKAKVSSTTKLDNVKAAIVAWSGTADSVTSDIISSWGIEGTNPTLIANATYENTPANLSLTTSYATYTITANVDTASTKNLIVFIWSDVTDTTLGDFLYITDVQLEDGTSATGFERLPYNLQISLCLRYAYLMRITSTGRAETTTLTSCPFVLPQQMFAAPTGTIMGTIVVRDLTGAASRTANSPSINAFNVSANGGYIEILASSWSAANFTIGNLCFLNATAANSGILCSAEL